LPRFRRKYVIKKDSAVVSHESAVGPHIKHQLDCSVEDQFTGKVDMLRKQLLVAAIPLLLAACGTVPTRTPHEASAPIQAQMPHAPKIVLVILENKDADKVVENLNALPFLKRLHDEGAYLSNYYGVAHPSQPNYVALVSGSVEGIDGDSPATLDRAHLGRQLDQNLKFWKVYAEGYPSGSCNLSEKIPTGHGDYARKHVPFLSFTDIQKDTHSCSAHVTGFENFAKDVNSSSLPSFSLVIPNLTNDAHNPQLIKSSSARLEVADQWLEKNVGPVLDDAEFKRDVILIVTFDENDDYWPYFWHTGNKVFTVLWGGHVIHKQESTVYDHYDLHRSIEANFGLAHEPASDKDARVIQGIWR
jgi:hypothetical protein